MNKKKDRKIKDKHKWAALLVFFLPLLIICIASISRITAETRQGLANTQLTASTLEEQELFELEDQQVPLAAMDIMQTKPDKPAFDTAKITEEIEQKALMIKAAVSEIEIDKKLVEQRKDELLSYIRTYVSPFGTDAIEAVRETVLGDSENKKIINGSIIDDAAASIVDSALTTVGSEKGTK